MTEDRLGGWEGQRFLIGDRHGMDGGFQVAIENKFSQSVRFQIHNLVLESLSE